MLRKALATHILVVIVSLSFCSLVSARVSTGFLEEKIDVTSLQASDDDYAAAAHRVGKMVLTVGNNGTFGDAYTSPRDYFTDEYLLSCEYPKGSNTKYLWAGAFWIGAVVGLDTLVSMTATGYSMGTEFTPEPGPYGPITRRSTISSEAYQLEGAISEEDYIAVYTDTVTTGVDPDVITNRPHKPLYIEVTQASYAWSYAYAEDFVLFDYTVRNIGSETLEDVYMGIYVDADVYFGQRGTGYYDDICGFVETIPVDDGGCRFIDTVNIAWIADNDGDPYRSSYFTDQSVRHVTGTRIIRTPSDRLDVSFNWWISNIPRLDFGPRELGGVGRLQEDFRDFGWGGLGTPYGDANSYYQMRNMEFDYDQVYTATIGNADTVWLEPNPTLAGTFADGYDTRYLLSFGPFEIGPGQRLPISFAYVAGENFHQIPNNLSNLPLDPDAYYANVDFSDLALNAAWAGRVYDNPGVDTDGDGFAGKMRICCNDSIAYSVDDTSTISELEFWDPSTCEMTWYEGDGVPDFRGASPPPGPEFWLEPKPGRIHVRINGFNSETAKDAFSGYSDFEGYRVYVARDDREASYCLVGSYDREDYNKYVWTGTVYKLFDIPYTVDSLRILYGDAAGPVDFDPVTYTKDNPFFFKDSVFYFRRQDFNASEFGTQTPIGKTYPNQPYPSTLNPDSASADELTEDGYFKYFEYEFEIKDLLPTVPYWVNVTAFDFGSPQADLKALESSLGMGAKSTYANTPVGEVADKDLDVYIYPNPYRSDARYRVSGFEGRDAMDYSNDRVRAIHFANLPAKCTIRIYSLDGDLIRELDHDCDPNDPSASHEVWNMITRNTQMIVSGMYYWTVEEPNGRVQTGKLVVIM